MNRDIINEADRDKAKRKDLEDALKDVLLAPAPARPRSENREPTRDELTQRWKLSRDD